jgi:hypothetical protein
LVEERPVESEVTPLWVVLMPLDAEVDSEVTLLLVEDRPVESEVIPLAFVLMPEDADVESEPT